MNRARGIWFLLQGSTAALFILFPVLAVPFAAGQVQSTSRPDEPIRLSTELVIFDAQVLEKKTGRVIGGLKREDFEVYEDGTRQDITYFSQDKLPITVVLLFDLTDSSRPVLKDLAASALKALEHLKPEDEVAVMVYAASAHLVQDFTKDRQLAVDAIAKASEMTSKEAAFFNEAVFQASVQTRHSNSPESRRIVIWLTDGVPNIPTEAMREHYGKSVPAGTLHTERAAFDEVFESGAVVCGIITHSVLSEPLNLLLNKNPIGLISAKHNPPGSVNRYAEQTGGEVINASGSEIGGKLAELIDHLRTRYSFGYAPSDLRADNRFRRIKLKLSAAAAHNGEAVVKSKQGYYRRAPQPVEKEQDPAKQAPQR